jgi:hypothetical protein
VKGVCVNGQRIDEVNVGGSQAVDDVTCGAGRSCGSLDFALHSRINSGGKVNIIGNTTLSSDGDITGVSILGQGETQTVMVSKSVTLSFIGNLNNPSTLISNVLFNITSSAVTNTLLLALSGGFVSSLLNLRGVSFSYRPALNSPLVSIDGLRNVNLENVKIERVVASVVNGGMLDNGKKLDNADDSICAARTNNPGLLLTNFIGNVSKCSFANINTGAIVINGGNVILDGVVFTNNSISRPAGFVNLRHNIFISNGAELAVKGVEVDTQNSYFIYTAENSGVVVNNVESPLFVPVFESAQPSSLMEGDTTPFVFTGGYLYPCGLYFNFYRDDITNSQPAPISLNVPDETTATVTLPNNLFLGGGRYFGYFVYGPGLKLRTPPVELLVGSASSEGKGGSAGLVVGIVIAIIAVVAVLFVVMFFLAWRYRIQKRWSTESAAERSRALIGESSKVYLSLCVCVCLFVRSL